VDKKCTPLQEGVVLGMGVEDQESFFFFGSWVGPHKGMLMTLAE